MAGRILQVNFKFSVSRAEYEQAVNSVWTMNEAESEAGGVYYFDDESSLQAYLAGPLAATVKSHPAFSEMSVKQFEVMADVTAVTRGPV